MKVSEFINIMEEIAPPVLKESYDNVGLMVGDRNADVDRILVALDCTKDVIEEAKDMGAQLILSHHPLLFRKPSSITGDTLQGEKIRLLVKNDISLYSSHTNWDSVKGGLNEKFAEVLGIKESRIIEKNQFDKEAGIGRIGELSEPVSLGEMIKKVKEEFGIDHLRYAGDIDKKIKTVALINGSGQEFFDYAYRMGADLVITGDTTYHFVADYSEMGMAVIDMGHFNSEWHLLKLLVSEVGDKVSQYGVSLSLSEKCADPYKFA